MASNPIISCQKEGGKLEAVTDFTFLGSKITVDTYCIHKIKRHLILGEKVMTNLESIIKSRNITLLTKICIVKSMFCFVLFFPVVMYRCESWTIKKTECQGIGAFKLWCWRGSSELLGLQEGQTSLSERKSP